MTKNTAQDAPATRTLARKISDAYVADDSILLLDIAMAMVARMDNGDCADVLDYFGMDI